MLRLVLVVLMMVLVMFYWLGLVVVVLIVLGQVALQRMLEQVRHMRKRRIQQNHQWQRHAEHGA